MLRTSVLGCCLLVTPLSAQQVEHEGAAVAAPSPTTADELLALLAEVRGLQAEFVEEKHLSLLAVPLESRGRLYYLHPGFLARHVTAPERTELVITPKTLRMRGEDGEEVIDLRQNDALRVFVTSLVRVLSGDRAGLAEAYEIEFVPAPDDGRWRLRLVPRREPLTKMLRVLELRGVGAAVEELEVQEPNGDRSVTRITAADPRRRFSAAERRQLFGPAAVEAGRAEGGEAKRGERAVR